MILARMKLRVYKYFTLYAVSRTIDGIEGDCCLLRDSYLVLRDTLCVSRNAVKRDTRAESFVSRFCSPCFTRRRPMRVELHSLLDDAVQRVTKYEWCRYIIQNLTFDRFLSPLFSFYFTDKKDVSSQNNFRSKTTFNDIHPPLKFHSPSTRVSNESERTLQSLSKLTKPERIRERGR